MFKKAFKPKPSPLCTGRRGVMFDRILMLAQFIAQIDLVIQNNERD